MSALLPEPAGGAFLRTTPATKVTIWNDGRVQFTNPDGSETWGGSMITGQELYELLQARAYGFLWAGWGLIHPEVKQAFEAVAEELNNRQAERVFEATAGEDI